MSGCLVKHRLKKRWHIYGKMMFVCLNCNYSTWVDVDHMRKVLTGKASW